MSKSIYLYESMMSKSKYLYGFQIFKNKLGAVSNLSNAKEKITNQNQNISIDSKISKKNWG